MEKVNSRADLTALRQKYKDNVIMRLVSDNVKDRKEINVGIGECGMEKGARQLLTAFFDEVNAQRQEQISVIAVDCFGDCANEPIVEIIVPGKAPVRHTKVDIARVKDIVKEVANA